MGLKVKKGSVWVAHYHFPRLWAERNDERSYTFPSGHVYGKTERRNNLRVLIAMMRRERSERDEG